MATDQRKRTMDALERRFAVAKAELVQQQQKKHKVTHHEGHRKENNNAASTSLHRADAPKTPSSSLSKKGSSFFFGYTPSQDPDENGLAYSQLPQAVHENLLTSGVKFESKKGSVVDKILHELFQHGDASQKYMQGSRNIKIDNWILLDNYVPSKSAGSQTRASQSNPKHSRRHMSMKQYKKLGMLNLRQDLQKFDVYKRMHEIWKDYMMQLLKKTGRNELPKCLLSADLHGAAILGHTLLKCLFRFSVSMELWRPSFMRVARAILLHIKMFRWFEAVHYSSFSALHSIVSGVVLCAQVVIFAPILTSKTVFLQLLTVR